MRADPGFDFGHDRLRRFAARIVAGDVNAIRKRRCNAAHLRALAAIAIAAAPEHDGQLVRRRFAQRDQRVLERIGRMRVVDHDVDIARR